MAEDDGAYIQFAQVFGELQRSTATLRDPHSGKDDRLVDIPNVAENGEIAAADSTQRTIMVGARSGSPRATPDTRRSTAAASASRRAPHRGGGRWQWPG
jgi:hypothetical protein